MTEIEILNKMKSAAIEKYNSYNCYAIQKETGLSYMQIEKIFNPEKKPIFKTILKYCQAVGIKLNTIDI